MHPSKKILVISYTFPPTPGIGGRRWAKFSKELIAVGHDVKVMTFISNSQNSKTSEWSKDIRSFKDKIKYYPSCYPKWLVAPNSFMDKIMYRLSLLYVKLFTEGNYYDRASFLKKKVIKEVQKQINNGYNNIIVTCAPFKLAYWISELIIDNPTINFVVDFRDPWANNLTSYGLNEMSQKRRDFELMTEKTVVTKFNKVFVVAKEMKEYFVGTYNLPENKIEVISNGFDENDFINVFDNELTIYFKENKKKKVVFTGTFYDNSLYLLKELNSVLNKNALLKNSLEFHFFGTMSNDAKIVISQNSENLFFHGSVNLNDVYKIIRLADYCSLFLTDDINYSFSTKFLEYLSQKKQILVFSNGGSTGDFVEANQLGFSINSKCMEEKLTKCLSCIEIEDELNSFSIEEYNIKNLTKKVSGFLQ